MSSKLSAKLLVLALLVVALPHVASASSARVEGLGLQNDYVMDYTNVFVYPSLVGQYQNLVYGDLGRKDVTGGTLSDFQDNNQSNTNDANRAMGAILGNLWGGKAGVWSLHFNENATPMSSALGAQYFNRNANEALDLIWGYKFQKMSLGITLNKSYSSEELQNGTIIIRPFTPGGSVTTVTQFNTRQFYNTIASAVGSQDWNSTCVGAGASFDLGGSDKPTTLDVSGQLRWLTFEQSDTTNATKFEDQGGVSYAVNARLHWGKSEDFHLMPVVNYYHLDLGAKFSDRTATNNQSFDRTAMGFAGALVGSWKLRDSDWFWLGANYEMSKIDLEGVGGPINDPVTGQQISDGGHVEVNYQNAPGIFGALESNLWPWFSVRLGAGKPLFSTLKITDKDTPELETKYKDSPLQYSVGVGFHFAKIDIDALVNQDFAFSGGWFSSGNSETPFSKLSATYRW